MRACIVFNPTARGNKARRLQTLLESFAGQCTLLPTPGPGTTAALAAQACRDGFDTVIAAGGDGTVSEVAHGLATVPGALDTVRLGVIPLGTMNVFARELGLPRSVPAAWQTIQQGGETRVDLPQVELTADGRRERKHFVQLAGAGLDSRAIAAVDWRWKKRIGPLAYALAGFKAMRGPQPRVRVNADGRRAEGVLALLGNGRLYGGEVRMFPQSDLRDGRLEVRVFPRVTLLTLVRFAWGWLARRPLGESAASSLQGERVELNCATPMPLELDGDNAGHLPAVFTVRRVALRVLVPAPGRTAPSAR